MFSQLQMGMHFIIKSTKIEKSERRHKGRSKFLEYKVDTCHSQGDRHTGKFEELFELEVDGIRTWCGPQKRHCTALSLTSGPQGPKSEVQRSYFRASVYLKTIIIIFCIRSWIYLRTHNYVWFLSPGHARYQQ